MKEKILIFVVFFFLTFALFANLVRAEKVLILMFTLCKNDTVYIKDVKYAEAPTILPKSGDYKIDILDDKDKVISSNMFDAKFLILTDPPTEVDEILILFRLPWQSKFFKANIYHSSNLIHTIDFSKYICNYNSICEQNNGESEYLCPWDCSCGNNKCDSNFGENHESCPLDCPIETAGIPIYIYIVLAAVFISLVIVFLLKIKRSGYK